MKFQGLDRFPAVRYVVTEKQAEAGCGFSLALHRKRGTGYFYAQIVISYQIYFV